jgi:S-DNA-T family DNA segregation ATPase FtsK/SpoIIIE
MLFSSNEVNNMRRIQGAFVSDEETNKVVKFWKRQDKDNEEEDELKESFKEELEKSGSGNTSGSTEGGGDLDEKFEEAKQLIITANKASTSLLQSRLSIGYQRANRIMMQLEDQGVVGPSKGAKPRDILIGKQDSDFSQENENNNVENAELEDEGR